MRVAETDLASSVARVVGILHPGLHVGVCSQAGIYCRILKFTFRTFASRALAVPPSAFECCCVVDRMLLVC